MDILQAMDQMQAFLRDIAPLLKKYKEDLIKQGFTEEEAFQLVRDFQNKLIRNGQ